MHTAVLGAEGPDGDRMTFRWEVTPELIVKAVAAQWRSRLRSRSLALTPLELPAVRPKVTVERLEIRPWFVRARAQEAYWFYQSQDGNHCQGVLKPLSELPREEMHWRILDWTEHER